jgi:hypothetical protein
VGRVGSHNTALAPCGGDARHHRQYLAASCGESSAYTEGERLLRLARHASLGREPTVAAKGRIRSRNRLRASTAGWSTALITGWVLVALRVAVSLIWPRHRLRHSLPRGGGRLTHPSRSSYPAPQASQPRGGASQEGPPWLYLVVPLESDSKASRLCFHLVWRRRADSGGAKGSHAGQVTSRRRPVSTS